MRPTAIRITFSIAATTALVLTALTPLASAKMATTNSDIDAQCAQEEQQIEAKVADSNSLTTPIVTAGKVFNAEQQPASGVSVRLLAWPGQAEMERAKSGGNFQLTPIGRATTSPDGRYALKADPGINLSKFANEAGYIEVSLDADTGTSFVTRDASIPIEQATIGRAMQEAQPANGDTGPPSTLPRQLDLTLRTVQRSSAEDTAQIRTLSDDSQMSTFVQGSNLGTKRTNVGSLFIRTTGVWGRVIHKTNANSEIGVGVDSGSGYEASGTVMRSSSDTLGFPRYGRYTYKHFYTERPFSKYNRYNCYGYWVSSTVKATPYGSIAGTYNRDASKRPRQPQSRCAAYLPGSYHAKEEGYAQTWGGGAKLSSTIGINLSTRTGYSTAATLNFDFMTSGKAMCGTRAHPAYQRPGAFVIQNW